MGDKPMYLDHLDSQDEVHALVIPLFHGQPIRTGSSTGSLTLVDGSGGTIVVFETLD